MKDLIPQEIIEQKIFLVHGQKVMLDRDLAELYGVETRMLNQAVKRNKDRFPEDFMVKLDKKEIMRISQIVTSLKFSKSVYAFTEQGVAMLSSILNSKRAIQVNIAVIRTFVKLRKVISTHKELSEKLARLEQKFEKHDGEIQNIFEAIRQLMIVHDEPKRKKVGFLK